MFVVIGHQRNILTTNLNLDDRKICVGVFFSNLKVYQPYLQHKKAVDLLLNFMGMPLILNHAFSNSPNWLYVTCPRLYIDDNMWDSLHKKLPPQYSYSQTPF
jgi:hypothetical protein